MAADARQMLAGDGPKPWIAVSEGDLPGDRFFRPFAVQRVNGEHVATGRQVDQRNRRDDRICRPVASPVQYLLLLKHRLTSV